MHRGMIFSQLLALVTLLVFGVRAGAQETFEVAVVKESKRQDVTTLVPGVFLPGSRWSAQGATLAMLVRSAYELPADRVLGLSALPAWTRADRFSVDAKAAEPDTPPAELRAMAQRLLADRFGLRAHIERRVTKVYALVLANAAGNLGKGLRPSTANCRPTDTVAAPPVRPSTTCEEAIRMTNGGAMRFQLRDRPVADVLILTGARSEVEYLIVDRTGLVGRFDIDLEFVPQDDQARSDIRIGLPFSVAVQEQLGLRLEPRVEPLDVLVVDGIAKPSLD